MSYELDELSALTVEAIELPPSNVLSDRLTDFDDASIVELFDLFDEATISYSMMAAHLPPNLRNSARQEILFFAHLLRDRIGEVIQRFNFAESPHSRESLRSA